MGQSQSAEAIGLFIMSFTGIVYEALPFVVLGAIIAGLLEELLPQQLITRFLGQGRVLPIILGALLGLLFPMCECGIIPIMRRLLKKGLPLSCCTAYLLAGPIINVIVLLSTYTAFTIDGQPAPVEKTGYQMTAIQMLLARAGLAFIVSVVTSFFVELQWKKYGTSLLTPLATPPAQPLVEETQTGPRRSLWQRTSNVSETALHDCVDILVFLILGALLASTLKVVLFLGAKGGALGEDALKDWSNNNMILTIVIMMTFAVIVCLCSEADAFVAASFSTMHPAAKLAFLVLDSWSS